MLKFLISKIKGAIVQYKRRNLHQYWLAGECVRTYIFRESQKIWVNLDGSYVLLPDWYIEKEVTQDKNN